MPCCGQPYRRAYIFCNADPFRPARPPIEPMVINAIQALLGSDDTAAEVAAAALEARAADPDYALTSDEMVLFEKRVLRVGAARSALSSLLEQLVDSAGWIQMFKAAPSFGVGPSTDPYARLCRAECMLALVILHVEGGTVEFIDEDRLEVLRDNPSADALEELKSACASATS
eukprot:CAMPEP_0115863956 /NCGR_PEP_ID=MMETSP0287-20121206/18952_1 /TAXON_ID=412157 /ORGANISM="Chrysochromulina rotalis, Strain UIO044" /LENGTH=172 /DNA_ID=CAMNT_0003318411 /DNA_START=1 /DNA_END=519 /DNA_ORIENTATION=-